MAARLVLTILSILDMMMNYKYSAIGLDPKRVLLAEYSVDIEACLRVPSFALRSRIGASANNRICSFANHAIDNDFKTYDSDKYTFTFQVYNSPACAERTVCVMTISCDTNGMSVADFLATYPHLATILAYDIVEAKCRNHALQAAMDAKNDSVIAMDTYTAIIGIINYYWNYSSNINKSSFRVDICAYLEAHNPDLHIDYGVYPKEYAGLSDIQVKRNSAIDEVLGCEDQTSAIEHIVSMVDGGLISMHASIYMIMCNTVYTENANWGCKEHIEELEKLSTL